MNNLLSEPSIVEQTLQLSLMWDIPINVFAIEAFTVTIHGCIITPLLFRRIEKVKGKAENGGFHDSLFFLHSVFESILF